MKSCVMHNYSHSRVGGRWRRLLTSFDPFRSLHCSFFRRFFWNIFTSLLRITLGGVVAAVVQKWHSSSSGPTCKPDYMIIVMINAIRHAHPADKVAFTATAAVFHYFAIIWVLKLKVGASSLSRTWYGGEDQNTYSVLFQHVITVLCFLRSLKIMCFAVHTRASCP